MKTEKFTTKINFNPDVDFEDGAENITVTIDTDTQTIIETSHKINDFDKRFILVKFNGKY